MPFTLLTEVYKHYASYIYLRVNQLRYIVELLLFLFQVHEVTVM